MPKLEERKTITCFLESSEEILILRRSRQVVTYQARWAGISGSIDTTADEQALTEIREETGLCQEDIELVKKGEPLSIKDQKLGVTWLVHPYLFHLKDRSKVKIDWEHEEFKWIKPEDIAKFETVPKLKETLARVYPA